MRGLPDSVPAVIESARSQQGLFEAAKAKLLVHQTPESRQTHELGCYAQFLISKRLNAHPGSGAEQHHFRVPLSSTSASVSGEQDVGQLVLRLPRDAFGLRARQFLLQLAQLLLRAHPSPR